MQRFIDWSKHTSRFFVIEGFFENYAYLINKPLPKQVNTPTPSFHGVFPSTIYLKA